MTTGFQYDIEARNKRILENQIVTFEKPKDSRFIDHSNERYDRLEILYYIGQDKRHAAYYMARCDCGNEIIVNILNVRHANSSSCGCKQRELLSNRVATHKMTKSKIYSLWSGIIRRCYDTKAQNYPLYGGRGIEVCDEWTSYDSENKINTGFLNFNKWATENGYIEGLSIDRIDVNGNYEPSNCRWTTWHDQALNKRNNRCIEYRGYNFPITVWSEITGLPFSTIYTRNNRYWSAEDTLRTPLGNKRGNGFLCWEVKPEYMKYHR